MINDYNSDVYIRLLTIISLLADTEEGITVNELSERMGVRQSTIINDLRNLQEAAVLNMSIGPADCERSEYWCDKDAQIQEEEDNGFLLALYDGVRNDIPLKILYSKKDETFSVELTAFERMILCEYLKNHNMGEMIPNKKDIFVKNMTKPDYSVYRKLAKVNDAIREKKALQLKMLDENKDSENKNKIKNFIVFPLKVISLFSNGEYYVVSVCNKERFICNIENVKEIQLSDQSIEVPSELSSSILEEFDYRWGVGVNDGIFELEIKIYNEADMLNRLSKRLSSRKYGVWENYGDYAIYKDKVIDYAALKQWIMSYGSSIKVIKPQRLADDIVKSAEERLRRYENILKGHTTRLQYKV